MLKCYSTVGVGLDSRLGGYSHLFVLLVNENWCNKGSFNSKISYVKVRFQKLLSDALFTPNTDMFKQTILNTAYIITLEIFPSARE